jgi:hypothetical protein
MDNGPSGMKKLFSLITAVCLAVSTASGQTIMSGTTTYTAPGNFNIRSGVQLTGTWDFSLATVIGVTGGGGITLPSTANLFAGDTHGGIIDSGVPPGDVVRLSLPNVMKQVTTLPGLRLGTLVVSDNYRMTVTDTNVAVNATFKPVSLMLPRALGSGQYYHVNKIDASGNPVTVTALFALGDTINGQSSVTVGSQNGDVALIDYALGAWGRVGTMNPDDPALYDYARQSLANNFLGLNTFQNVTNLSGLQYDVTTVTTSYSVQATDISVNADASVSTTPVILLLLPATGSGQFYRFEKIDSTSQVVTVQASSGDVIAGSIAINFIDQHAGAMLQDVAQGYWADINTAIIAPSGADSEVSWWYRPELTSDALVSTFSTVGDPINSRLDVLYPTGAREYILRPNAADFSDPGQIAPQDYDASNNNVHWEQRL